MLFLLCIVLIKLLICHFIYNCTEDMILCLLGGLNFDECFMFIQIVEKKLRTYVGEAGVHNQASQCRICG